MDKRAILRTLFIQRFIKEDLFNETVLYLLLVDAGCFLLCSIWA